MVYRDTALIVIDVQEAVDDPSWEERNNPGAEENIAGLLEKWRKEGAPIFFVQYFSPRERSLFHEDCAAGKLKKFARPLPGEPLIVKHFESAFMATDLEAQLRRRNLNTLVFVGFFSDQCVAATVKAAHNLGFEVFVVSDATAAVGCRGYDNGKFYRAEDVHQLTLGSLKRDGLSITETEDLLKSKPGKNAR